MRRYYASRKVTGYKGVRFMNNLCKEDGTSLRNIVAPRQNLSFEVLKIYYASKGCNIIL